ncbi:cyanophycinase [Pedobacter steynii]|uniref:Cyanophycinase n=1 Tax=Pedobacter steynii TaxID=430522 RepID=A0A1D7QHC5_9SPHI|nr:cyanophycinase [Pedobacter steynii]AOM78071.1 cyanophycinase [Pedobacter steynii]
MKSIFIRPLLSCALMLTSLMAFAQQHHTPKGSLFIIGGGDKSPELIRELIKTADMTSKDYVVVLPMSSGFPEGSFEAIRKELAVATSHHISCLNFDASSVNDRKWLDSLTGARLIYITGGDQNRFMKVVLNTPVYQAIHEAYRKGATVAGTSAGAAVMSKYMITGKQLLGDTAYKATFDQLKFGNIEFQEGLGLLDSVIIDQHFVKRSRYNRLISALAAHPGFDCIGIDEGTAIIVRQKKIRVAGESQVLRIAGPKELKVTKSKHLKLINLQFSLYTEGDTFYTK